MYVTLGYKWHEDCREHARAFQIIVPGKENNNSIFTFVIFTRDQKISRD
jgi:hypothetical protein